jgi:hypothetical protein
MSRKSASSAIPNIAVRPCAKLSRHSFAFQGQTDARDNAVPRALLARRVVNQHAVDEPLRKVAAIVPNDIPLIARDCKEARRHPFVLNARRRISFRQKACRRLISPSRYRLDCQIGETVSCLKALSKPVRLPCPFAEY